MSKPVEVEFLMKDKLTPGMNKAEREALELRNTVRLLEAELERLRLAGETAAPNLDQSANIAQIHALEKQLEELRGKLKLLQEESESVQVTPADMPNAQRQFNGLHNSIQAPSAGRNGSSSPPQPPRWSWPSSSYSYEKRPPALPDRGTSIFSPLSQLQEALLAAAELQV